LSLGEGDTCFGGSAGAGRLGWGDLLASAGELDLEGGVGAGRLTLEGDWGADEELDWEDGDELGFFKIDLGEWDEARRGGIAGAGRAAEPGERPVFGETDLERLANSCSLCWRSIDKRRLCSAFCSSLFLVSKMRDICWAFLLFGVLSSSFESSLLSSL